MAQATVELGRLLQLDFKLFDFDYKFDDSAFKKELEQHVIDFYYDYEIGQETPDMFKRKFKTRWLRIIPYYNKLYNTTLLQYNPLINSKMTEALDQLSESSSSQSSKSNSSSNTKASDYPQQPIAGGDYLAGETTSDSDGSSSASGEGTQSTNYQKTVEGLTGTSYQELIQKERQMIINISNMVIAELKNCFILVY